MKKRLNKIHGDWILAKAYGTEQEKLEERVKKVGLSIPDNIERKERADKAFILEVSEKIEKEGIFKVGDKIAFLRFGPIEIEIDNERFLFIQSQDIIATI